MELVLDTLSGFDGWGLYVVVGLLVLGESAAVVALFLPGELALLAAGVVAARGHASVPALLLVGIVAAVSGHAVGYELGRRYGLALLRWRPLRGCATAADSAAALVARHGGAAVFLGRWMNVGRILVPLLVGAGRMRYRTFLLYNVIGGIAWVVTFVLLGAAAGASIEVVERTVGQVSWWLTGGVVVVAAGVWIRRRRRRRLREGPDERPTASAPCTVTTSSSRSGRDT